MHQLHDNIIPVQATATVTTGPIPAMNLFCISAQLNVVGAVTGTLKMQASNDQPTDATPPTNWSDITGATVTATSTGSYMIPKTEICYQYVRFVYTTAGTGTINVQVKALGS